MKIRRLFIFLLAAFFVFSGCKSHKCKCFRHHRNQTDSGVVQVPAPEFSVEDEWVLTTIRGKQVEYLEGQSKATACFNNENGSIHGRNGCNSYNASFKDHGNGKMTIGIISQTKMACPEPFHKLEVSFMSLLSKCDGYNLGEYSLDLLMGDVVVLSFVKNTDE